MTHSDYVTIGLGVLAAILVCTTAYLYSKSEDLKDALAFEEFEHDNTRADLDDQKLLNDTIVLTVAPLVERTAWSMGMPEARMRAAEVHRNQQVDRVKTVLKKSPTGKRLMESHVIF